MKQKYLHWFLNRYIYIHSEEFPSRPCLSAVKSRLWRLPLHFFYVCLQGCLCTNILYVIPSSCLHTNNHTISCTFNLGKYLADFSLAVQQKPVFSFWCLFLWTGVPHAVPQACALRLFPICCHHKQHRIWSNLVSMSFHTGASIPKR